jgi:hypothetical protein
MAWTAPRTWTDGELVTKTIMDAHVRDNFLAVGPHLIARKTADQSVTSSTTLVDCTTMTLPLLANEIWQFTFNVLFDAATAADIKLGFTFPTSGRIDATSFWLGSTDLSQMAAWSGTTTPSTAFTFAGQAADVRMLMPISGIFTNSTNAGNLQLQFAQATSNATATRVFANSTVWAVKLA